MAWMPPRLKKLRCQSPSCGRYFYAARRDTKFCNRGKCRYAARAEDAKFETPKIPKSGVEGVTFRRLTKRWIVKVKG